MNSVHALEFRCVECEKPITFSALAPTAPITCPSCQRRYTFDSEGLSSHLQKFEALCQQLRDSDEILSNASVAVDVRGHEVQIPFRLLLTRLNSVITLQIDGKQTEIRFRIDPSQELKYE